MVTRSIGIKFDKEGEKDCGFLPAKANLSFRSLEASEQVSDLFKLDLELACKSAIDMGKVLGHCLTIKVDITENNITRHRYFNGHVANITLIGQVNNENLYKIILRPWLWFLTRRTNCRVAEGKKLNDILKLVFDEYAPILADHLKGAFTDGYELTKLDSAGYKNRDYCVQYRETDFEFINRIMEQEGVYYYFAHNDAEHKMVVIDNKADHQACFQGKPIKLQAGSGGSSSSINCVYQWQDSESLQPGSFSLADFWFKEPTKLTKAATMSGAANAFRNKFTQYDYPGEFGEPLPENATKANLQDAGTALAAIKRDAASVLAAYGSGRTNVIEVGAGTYFQFEKSLSTKIKMFITSATHHFNIVSESGELSPQGTAFHYTELSAIDNNHQYRPTGCTPKPVVSGPQTAMVLGENGALTSTTQRVYSDDYGRIRVLFHWDHGTGSSNALRAKTHTSSCWLRVSQIFAGPDRGAMIIPHIGEEVIVSFLEGDPDRPIVTGRVFNINSTSKAAFDQTESTRSINGLDIDPDSTDINFLKPNQDKIQIKDHYGNQIVLDSTTGTEGVKLYSPRNKTLQEVGPTGIVAATESDHWEFINGSTFSGKAGWTEEFYWGGKTEQAFGLSSSIFLGTSFDIWGGTGIDANIGFKFDFALAGFLEVSLSDKVGFAWANEDTITLGQKIETVKDEMVLESTHEYMVLVGGKVKPLIPAVMTQATGVLGQPGYVAPTIATPEVPGNSRQSIIELRPEKLLVSFGKVEKLEDTSKNKKAKLGQTISTVAMVISACIATAGMVGAGICGTIQGELAKNKLGGEGWAPGGAGIAAGVVGGVATVVGLGAGLAKMICAISADKYSESPHDAAASGNTATQYSNLLLDKDKFTLCHNVGGKIAEKAIVGCDKGEITIDNSAVVAGKDITMKSAGNVKIEATKGVEIKSGGKTFTFNTTGTTLADALTVT